MPQDPPRSRSDAAAAAGSAPASDAPGAVLRAVRRVLAPLVRLLIAHQITFPVLSQLLKAIYVEEATRGFALSDRPQTISRLTLLTGVHRKDVKRLQAEALPEPPAPASVSIGAQLVLRWTAEPTYQDSQGRPAPLPRRAGSGHAPSFEALVTSVTQDIRPRAILDEWLRLGVARLDADDRVHLVEEAFVPAHGFDEKAYYLGRNLRDHAAAAVRNVLAEDDPLLERSVYYARLRPESVDTLEQRANTLGMEALQQLNEQARLLQRQDEGAIDADQRMSFGVYFFRAPIAHDADSNDAESDERAQAAGDERAQAETRDQREDDDER